MADRAFYPSVSYGLGRVYLEFGFSFNSTPANAPATSSVYGADCVASFAHTGGANDYTVTLKDKFNKFIDGNASILGGTASGDWASIDSVSNENSTSAISFVIKTWQPSGSARNDEVGRCGVTIAFRNTKQMPGAGAV